MTTDEEDPRVSLVGARTFLDHAETELRAHEERLGEDDGYDFAVLRNHLRDVRAELDTAFASIDRIIAEDVHAAREVVE